jgi:hypothetical protein
VVRIDSGFEMFPIYLSSRLITHYSLLITRYSLQLPVWEKLYGCLTLIFLPRGQNAILQPICLCHPRTSFPLHTLLPFLSNHRSNHRIAAEAEPHPAPPF